MDALLLLFTPFNGSSINAISIGLTASKRWPLVMQFQLIMKKNCFTFIFDNNNWHHYSIDAIFGKVISSRNVLQFKAWIIWSKGHFALHHINRFESVKWLNWNFQFSRKMTNFKVKQMHHINIIRMFESDFIEMANNRRAFIIYHYHLCENVLKYVQCSMSIVNVEFLHSNLKHRHLTK